MFETVALIANVSLALSFVAALIFGISQAKAAARDRKERFTLETLRFYQSREFAELSVYIIQGELPKTRDELNSLPREERIFFTDFSQKMEALGLLVAEGLVDIDLIDKTVGDFVITAWKKYRTLFLELRKIDSRSISR